MHASANPATRSYLNQAFLYEGSHWKIGSADLSESLAEESVEELLLSGTAVILLHLGGEPTQTMERDT